MKNYIKAVDELNQSHVHIKDPDKVNEIIMGLINGGCKKLQIVSDFDRTITKQHENGTMHLSSFGMFSRCPSVSEQHKLITKALADKYAPIEVDPTIPYDEKRELMEEWWKLSEDAIKGLKVTSEEIERVCVTLGPSIRTGTRDFFIDLYEAGVPVLIFSAGLGDTVVAVLKHCDVLMSNIEVVSNFLKYNEDGTILGFKGNIIHVFNKNEYAIKGTDFYNKVLDRENVILMGDSTGDATMVEGIEHLTSILKIGFLYERREESLPSYKDTFDIVLEDDQTMNVPKAIFKLIQSEQNAQTELGEN